MLQGVDPDESDVEWDEDIRHQFGARSVGHARGDRRELDAGMAMENLVQHTFHVYDGLVGDLGVA